MKKVIKGILLAVYILICLAIILFFLPDGISDRVGFAVGFGAGSFVRFIRNYYILIIVAFIVGGIWGIVEWKRKE